MSAPHVGFLGLGVMGGPMAANLARAGYAVTAWNRSPERPGIQTAAEAGATVAASLPEAVAAADIVVTCLGDVPDVERVLLGEGGVATHARRGTLVADMTTIGPEATRRIAGQLQQQGLSLVDAPVSGGDVGAQNGTLTVMAGGEPAEFERCYPLFAVMGQTIRHCGPVGSGQAVKLCNQTLASLHVVALCEAMQLARQQGLDPNTVVEVCSTGAAGSWILANLGPKLAAADPDLAPGFAIGHMLKDLRLVRESVPDASELPGTQLAERLFQAVAQLEDGRQQGTQAMILAYRDPE